MLERGSTAATTSATGKDEELIEHAHRAFAAGDLAQALQWAQKALSVLPERPRAHAVKAFLEARRGDLSAAVAGYERAIALDQNYLVAYHHLAYALLQIGRRREALGTLDALIALDPTNADAQRLRIVLTAELGDPDLALVHTETALEQLPENLDVVLARGIALRIAERLPEALEAQQSILAKNPKNPAALAEKGAVLHALGRYREALDTFDLALEDNENFVYALNGIGLAELALDMREAALAAFNQALVLEPGNVDSLFYRAMALEAFGRYEEALATYDQVLLRRPDAVFAWNNIGKIRRDMGLVVEAEVAFRRALAIDADQPRIHSNLLLTLLYDPEQSMADLAVEHRAWGERFGRPLSRYTAWENDRDPDRPLRVGIVAAEFCRHALASWLLTGVEALRRAGFTVICYANRSIEDPVTEQFKVLASQWRVVVGTSDSALAAQIRADRIDVLFDISGHTADSRLGCFALKPAPVQVSWLGYPFSTGLAAIDYSLMDEVAVRPGEECHFVEEVVRLPGGRACYTPPADAPPVVAPPCTRLGWITFGSFNQLAKLTPEVLRTWCQLLHRLPTSRLVLKSQALGNSAVADRLRAAICDTGITSGRIELRGASDLHTLLTEYGDIDIALDPFPFSGGVTSCEALWMGVPVVTLDVAQPVSRQTSGFLQAIGRPDWIAGSVDDYMETAVRLAADPARLEELRAAQRNHMSRSTLCDSKSYAKNLGREVRAMWRRYATTSSQLS